MDSILRKKQKIKPVAPFVDKIPFILSLILGSIDKSIIEKVYLFGSYAYGKPKKDSDIDICVIIDNNSDRPEVQLKIKCVLMDNKIIPSDLLVFNFDKFYGAKNPDGIEKTIMKYGKLLYEK